MSTEEKQNFPTFQDSDSIEHPENENVLSRSEIMELMIPYIKEETKNGTRLNQIMRHTIGLFHGQKGSSYWKRYLSENMCIREADLLKVNHIMDHIKNNN